MKKRRKDCWNAVLFIEGLFNSTYQDSSKIMNYEKYWFSLWVIWRLGLQKKLRVLIGEEIRGLGGEEILVEP